MGRPEWQRAIADILKEAAKDARVDVLATIIIPATGKSAKQEAKYPFGIVNYISLLGKSMGIEYPDVYKQYKIMADPDTVFNKVEAYVRANKRDPEQVREVLDKAFAPPCEADSSNPS